MRIYNAIWKTYCGWCLSKHIVPVDSSVSHALEFLQDGLEKGLLPNTIRRQVPTLSTILTWGEGQPLSHHPLVWRFLKGASNLRPPAVHRYPSWDLSKVLEALTGPPFEPLPEVPMRILTWKVAFLVAITSARKISELHTLSMRGDLCKFYPDRVVLRLDPSFIPRVGSWFHRAQEVVLPNFCPSPVHPLEHQWHTLDVCRALEIYLQRTASLRHSEGAVCLLPGPIIGPKGVGGYHRTVGT